MKLYQIVLKDVLRRKRRGLYAALGVVIGTMTVIGILTIALAGEARIYNQLEKYGPNLTVALATLIAVIATVYPALQATRIKVADSFRSL